MYLIAYIINKILLYDIHYNILIYMQTTFFNKLED